MIRRPLVSTLMINAPIIVPRIDPSAAAERRSADDDRGDGLQLVAHAQCGLGRVQARGDEDACQAGEHAREA